MANIDDLPKAIALIRKLLKVLAADRETQAAIETMSDDEIFAFARSEMDDFDEQNDSLIERLRNKLQTAPTAGQPEN